ncbi:histidinol-phosphate aminotransferase [Macrolepiota fuliginosa MF-IS2]|uniref:histidinol-phosphate transaminase n=1 Tax=Macrolepiota fuliginosa MF-IS2 TaxID=1400762 RepID=A0A9P5X950_9AGAR|nr:histidinol-phosphate aminotransferase [Macrolepiota fuliginosa MF-IS2]
MPIHGLKTLGNVNPPHFNIENVIRPNILALHPYRCARDDYSEGILLDANENALGHSIPKPSSNATLSDLTPDLAETLDLDLHRYPSPSHPEIKARIAALRGLPSTDYIFLGVGSDEVIDLVMRVCVAPGKEKILITPPTYGMYVVSAQVNDIGVVKVPLELSGANGEGGENGRFSVRVDKVLDAVAADPSIKLIFLCSPGNPSTTLVSLNAIRTICSSPKFNGIVIVDEAYIDFVTLETDKPVSAASLVEEFSNLVVFQTLSKSFGLAAIRLGIALAQPPLIQILTNTKAPYNISTPTAHLALTALSPSSVAGMRAKVATLIKNRATLLEKLFSSEGTKRNLGQPIGAGHANFIMVPVLKKDGSGEVDNQRAARVYKVLAEANGLVVRFRGNELGCEACLRITIGTEEENEAAVTRLTKVFNEI